MDWLSFIAELIKAAAWPLAVVAMALAFRHELRALLNRVSKGRLGPAEFEFEQQVQVLAAQSARPGPAAATAAVATIMPATGAARQTILNAWRDLEHSAQGGASQLSVPDLALYQQLRALRDQVEQRLDFSPSPHSASSYVQLAHGLRARIEQARTGQGAAR